MQLSVEDPDKAKGTPVVCVGNPCNPANGNKFQTETDYIGAGSFPLMFARFHNSQKQAPALAPLGPAWTHSYSASIRLQQSSSLLTAYVLRPDGAQLYFNASSTSGPWTSDNDISHPLTQFDSAGVSKWKFTSNDQDVVEIYDVASGRLEALVNRAGLTQILQYDSIGRLLSVSDPFGKALTFAYDDYNRMSTITDPGAAQISYGYDTLGNLTSVTWVGGSGGTRSYAYGNGSFPHALTEIVDENGASHATWTYDASGRVTSSQHSGGAARITIDYPTATTTAVTTFVDAAVSATRTYEFETQWGLKRLAGIAGPPCPACGPASINYDANGNPAARIDWNGNRTNYTYDLARSLETSKTEGLTSTGGTTPATRTIDTEWHPTFRLPTRITEKSSSGAILRETIISHDAAGNVLSRTVSAGGSPRTWSYTYNANGSVLEANGPSTDVSDITTYTYYANDDPNLGKRGNLHTITNALGHLTEITAYNAHSQPLTISDPNGLTTTLTYDERLRLTSKDVGGELTSYEYYPTGLMKKVTHPDGSFLSYTYDAAHRLTDITDALGNSIHYQLDAMGNRRVEEVKDPQGSLAQTRSRVFNSLNRLFQEIGAQNQTTQYAYDNQGNVTSVDGPLAGTVDVTINAYDALNRLIRITDPASGQVNYGYNALDQLTSVTDPRSLATSYGYNGLGDLNQQVSPDTGTTTNSHDAAGNLLTQTDGKGQITTYTYNTLNRVTTITFHDGSKQSYTYDQGVNGIGRLLRIDDTDPQNQLTARIDYSYDQKGRVISDERAFDSWATLHKVTYQYDAFGRLMKITYPFGDGIASSGRVDYGYDAQGRVNQVSTTFYDRTVAAMVTRVVVQNVQYHPFGGVKSFTFGNGQTYTRQFDQDGRIASYTLQGTQYNIGYDPASRISFIAENGNPSNVNDYGYDALDRLTSAILPFTNYGYAYDATGNRLSKTAGANTDTYAYGATSNRLSSITPPSGPIRNYAHDANGSVTDDGILQHVYDIRGRLVQSTHAPACLVSKFRVNALGQRMRKTITACDTGAPVNDTIYTYDLNGRVLSENHPTGGTYKRAYFYLYDIPVGMYLNESN